MFEILANRARKSLEPYSLHRQALTYVASNVSNIGIGLHWLQTAAETADDSIGESLVKEVQNQAYQRYVDGRLSELSDHHKLVYQAIEELTTERDRVYTGEIYDRYMERCEVYNEDVLSDRQISDFLKHLELLDLIEVRYHYGGRKGKTREIRLSQNL